MPSSALTAINFLETRWPSTSNNNKVNGVLAELRFKSFLKSNGHHYVSGGWIVIPGKPTLAAIPTKEKICLLPRKHRFSWQAPSAGFAHLTPAEMGAYNYFRQVGVRALFAAPVTVAENLFAIPTPKVGNMRAQYPRPYEIELLEVNPSGALVPVPVANAFRQFPRRAGNTGLNCQGSGLINPAQVPWTDLDAISDLFWFEYSRYYFQVDYLISNNDLDMFIIGPSGSAYPVELKSKSAATDRSLGPWFGIDMGPYAKLAFFTANAMNTDALYVVEEVDSARNHVEWYGIRFTELVKCCSWVGQQGGAGMTGGTSATFKIPKTAFTPLLTLMPTL